MTGEKPSIPRLTKTIASVMGREQDRILEAARWLSSICGKADLSSEAFVFDFTDYYRTEMGSPLIKQWFSFEILRPSSHLVRLKRRTAAYERATGNPSKGRVINIDPGYWSDAKLVLASTKNYSHRIQIGRRVFAEVTLRFYKGRLGPLEWTYPDYRTPSALDFFEKVRRRYWEQLSQQFIF